MSLVIFFCCGISQTDGVFLNAQMPAISILTDVAILDEPKVAGTFTFTDTDGTIISSNIGIEIRGGFSQSFPKKTYDVEFWNDPDGTETVDVQFGEMRNDDDWILDAMYNEPLRINSYLTHKLWLEMNQLYYADQEPEAKSGADVMYVEVNINNVYQGIYLLSEQIDRKQLKLKKNNVTEVRGELYKGYDSDDAVFFNDPDEIPNNNSFKWSGYEFRYPTDFIDWTNVEELVNFVANSSDEDFVEEIETRFDFKNLMDYFILLNIARILDNRGKNIYLCRYDAGEPYFLAPWDLDGSWGLLWNGTNDTKTEGILSNNLFDRIISTDSGGFQQRISNRWNELRTSLLSDDALENRINTSIQFLMDNQVYEKEANTWNYGYSESDLDYMFDWLEDRLEFLDDYFRDITDVEDLEDISDVNIYPNPAQDYITVTQTYGQSGPMVIYNLFGEIEMQQYAFSQDNLLDISNLVSGLYVLEIQGSKTIFVKK